MKLASLLSVALVAAGCGLPFGATAWAGDDGSVKAAAHSLLALGDMPPVSAPATAPSTNARPAPSAAPSLLQPEQGTGQASAKVFTPAKREAVVAAHPLAAQAGLSILKAGGSAIDAAIATAMVLGVVEPQSSGIGGGAFLMYFDGKTAIAYDGRETAPAAADETLFLKPDGQPLSFAAAVIGGRSVGVPGVLRMLELAHRAHGKLPWARLFQPAIELADNGFPVGQRLNGLLQFDDALRLQPAAAAFFYRPDGTPWPVGTMLRNPALAEVLRRIASEGPDAFYRGSVADAIVAKVRGHIGNPGLMTKADLAGYVPMARPAICSTWTPARRPLRLCGFPPPSSGAIAIGQILGMLQRLSPMPNQLEPAAPRLPADPKRREMLPSATALHRYTEASRLAFADRAAYVGDPAFVQPPAGRWDSLLDDAYLRQRAHLIGQRSMESARPGRPSGVVLAMAPDRSPELPSTSHLSIIDSSGQAAAMTTTIENQFGSRLLVSPIGLPGGFLLNNELTDFSFLPREDGLPVANRVEAGKRPRSSMSPTFVFDAASGTLLSIGGSAGGPMIIHHTAKVLLATWLWNLPVQDAVAMPNFGSMNGPTLLEAGRFPETTIKALRALGHDVREVEITSGLHWLTRIVAGPTTGPWLGGADPRREGVMVGE